MYTHINAYYEITYTFWGAVPTTHFASPHFVIKSFKYTLTIVLSVIFK